MKLNQVNLKTNFDNQWIADVKDFHSKIVNKKSAIKPKKLGKDQKIHPEFIFTCINNLMSNNFFGIADGGDILSFC